MHREGMLVPSDRSRRRALCDTGGSTQCFVFVDGHVELHRSQAQADPSLDSRHGVALAFHLRCELNHLGVQRIREIVGQIGADLHVVGQNRASPPPCQRKDWRGQEPAGHSDWHQTRAVPTPQGCRRPGLSPSRVFASDPVAHRHHSIPPVRRRRVAASSRRRAETRRQPGRSGQRASTPPRRCIEKAPRPRRG
eukprot:scaffold3815_cov251-Pinguiococcus_pyrenoidosus.AAC.5